MGQWDHAISAHVRHTTAVVLTGARGETLQRKRTGSLRPVGESSPPIVPPAAESPAAAAGPDEGVELAVRTGDGLEVALFWNRASGRLWVDVLHLATGEDIKVEADPAKALDVYYHPFAYCPGGRAHATSLSFEG